MIMKGFCEECREYKSYHVKEREKSKNINCKSIMFKEKVAYCCECGNEIFVSHLRDENLAAIEIAYREILDIEFVDKQ